MIKEAYEAGCRDAMEKLAGLGPWAIHGIEAGVGALGGALAGGEDHRIAGALGGATVGAAGGSLIRRGMAKAPGRFSGMGKNFVQGVSETKKLTPEATQKLTHTLRQMRPGLTEAARAGAQTPFGVGALRPTYQTVRKAIPGIRESL